MIFYFSATGNSYYAAKNIGSEIADELIDISKALRDEKFTYSVSPDEKVGFVIPLYFYGVPTIVADFISKLKLEGNLKPYLYGVITCGGSIEGADRMLASLLKKQNYKLNSTFELKMTTNYVLMYEIPTLEEQKSDLISADKKISTIVNAIKKNKNNDYTSNARSRLMTKVAYPLYKFGRNTRRFFADEKCNGCGKCARICPVNAIEMKNNQPVWTKRQCVHCLGCINRCPRAAIQFGNKTKSRSRFENPILKQ